MLAELLDVNRLQQPGRTGHFRFRFEHRVGEPGEDDEPRVWLERTRQLHYGAR